MVKNRKAVDRHSSAKASSTKSALSSSHDHNGHRGPKTRTRRNSGVVFGKTLYVVFFVCILLGCVQLWNYLTWSKLYTPYRGPAVVESMQNSTETMERLWGTYRPQLYFGMRTRTPESLLVGLMWFAQYSKDAQLHLRYTCEQGDNLQRYGWLYHDGRHFGSQEIVDDDFILKTEFVKRPGGNHGGEWTMRVSGRSIQSKSNQLVSIMFLVTNEGREKLSRIVKDGRIVEIQGATKVLGDFRMLFPYTSKNAIKSTYLSSYERDIYIPRDIVQRNLQYHITGKRKVEEVRIIGLSGDVKNEDGILPNFFVVQTTFKLPFETEIIFMSGSFREKREILTGPVFESILQKHIANFEAKFDSIFKLKEKGYNPEEIAFAQAALSNMIGGVGYFYGSSQVKSNWFKRPVQYWNSALYTAVPSRSFFPRGFLWDEGFHQLLLSRWDNVISFDIISHWLDLINAEGWIPREQILGIEARQKVPDEFVTQHNENANPPTLFLALDTILKAEVARDGNVSPVTRKYLEKLYPRLQLWFQWFNSTQTGELPSSYRWRGRDSKTDRELNPKTLTSGLDDYPRASHPSVDERHVDLRCWIALASGILYRIGKLINSVDLRYKATFERLTDNKLLDELHWCQKHKSYCDYGNHTKFVHLERRVYEPGGQPFMARVVRSKQGPNLKFVQAHGYISLFPFLLQIINSHSDKLKAILDGLRKSDLLWTPFGLRSLARSDPLYMKYNTEHDPPYWRGPIWINMNFLAIRALRYYADSDSPYKHLAEEIYQELRKNVIQNLFSQYQSSGYIWEQYNDKTGRGQGTFPFTGWSGLVTLIMGEIY